MNLKDYLHLYLGCEMQCTNPECYGDNERYGQKRILSHLLFDKYSNGNWKPLLRPLSDMTEEEMRETLLLKYPFFPYKIGRIDFFKDEPKRAVKYGSGVRYTMYRENGDHLVTGTLSQTLFEPKQFIYLLSKGFDLFGLIDAGLALDKTTYVSPQPNP